MPEDQKWEYNTTISERKFTALFIMAALISSPHAQMSDYKHAAREAWSAAKALDEVAAEPVTADA